MLNIKSEIWRQSCISGLSSNNNPAIFCVVFRIAKIKQIICLDVEAISLYEELLSEDAGYVPALQG